VTPESLLPLLDAVPSGAAVTVATVGAAGPAVVHRGSSRRTGGRPVDADTRFELGSLTKTFTALLLAEMAARGEVRLHDPIARYLPAGAAPAAAPGITLLHLATHTSGLPRLPAGLLRGALPRWFTNPYAHYTEQRLLAALPGTRVHARPGSRVHYSNLGVGLLGLILARAAGTGYADLLDARVCRPLGLTGTGCAADRAQATGYWHERPRPPWRIPALPGAGALRSTARDLRRYLEALLDPAAAGADGPLAAALTDVQRPRLSVPRSGDRLCLVWNLRTTRGGDLLFHSGATRGFTSFAGFCPRTGTALAALTNTSPAADGRFVQGAYSALRALHDTRHDSRP